ncbi:MAG: hypothetical protein LBG64_04290 [Pseudomonadales bacterium]|nr:hypothetical protein [Pseudomonadales bacterium]
MSEISIPTPVLNALTAMEKCVTAINKPLSINKNQNERFLRIIVRQDDSKYIVYTKQKGRAIKIETSHELDGKFFNSSMTHHGDPNHELIISNYFINPSAQNREVVGVGVQAYYQ